MNKEEKGTVLEPMRALTLNAPPTAALREAMTIPAYASIFVPTEELTALVIARLYDRGYVLARYENTVSLKAEMP